MLIQVPNGKWINPQAVQGAVAEEHVVSVIMSTWNQQGNHIEVLYSDQPEQLLVELVTEINESC